MPLLFHERRRREQQTLLRHPFPRQAESLQNQANAGGFPMYKKILAPLLAALLLALCACGGSPASQAPWERLYEQTGQLLQEQPAAQVGSVGGEGVIIGLSRSGLLSPQAA